MSINGIYGGSYGYYPQAYQPYTNFRQNGLENYLLQYRGGDVSQSVAQKEESSNGWLKALGVGLVGGAIYLLSRGKVKGGANVFKNPKLAKAQDKAWEYATRGTKKTRIKGTSVTGASRPVTNAREAEIVQNINTQHVNGNTRQIVERASRDVVTPQMQARYDREIAHRALTAEEKQAKAIIDSQNRAQRAELNSVANNSKGGENLDAVRTTARAQEAAAAKVKDGLHTYSVNGNSYNVKNGQVVEIRTATPNSKGECVITDPKKIAKHMAKHNVNIADFVA